MRRRNKNPRPPQLTEKEMQTIRMTTKKVLGLIIANSWYQEGMNKYPYFLSPILENNIAIGIGFQMFDNFRTYGQNKDKIIVILVESEVVGSCDGRAVGGRFEWISKPSNAPFDGKITIELENWDLFSFQQLARHNRKFLADFSVNDLKEYLNKIKYTQNRACKFDFIDDLDDEELEEYFILPAKERAKDITPDKVRKNLYERFFSIIYHELIHAKQFDDKNRRYVSVAEDKGKYISQFVEIQPRLAQIIQDLVFQQKPIFYQRKMSLSEYLFTYSYTFQKDSKFMSDKAFYYILQGTYQWLKENNLVNLEEK